jgi:hypothetical protein
VEERRRDGRDEDEEDGRGWKEEEEVVRGEKDGRGRKSNDRQ